MDHVDLLKYAIFFFLTQKLRRQKWALFKVGVIYRIESLATTEQSSYLKEKATLFYWFVLCLP